MKTAWMVACVLSISVLPTVINAQGVIGGAQQGASQGARQGSKEAKKQGGKGAEPESGPALIGVF